MDAREQLRRYLEQRREMGERELILDGMSVEDVMRILGAGTGGATTKPQSNVGTVERSAPTTMREERQQTAEGSSDWREVLRSTGSEPTRPSTPRPIEASQPAASSKSAPAAPEAPPGIVVGTASRELFGGALSSVNTLEDLAALIEKCTKCPLYRTATKAVPGQGNPKAELVCVGEAPGEKEDKSGQAFVGDAGQLLTKILSAINLRREDVFICNVLKHRPPQNRNPMPQEVEACSPYLVRQLEIIRPKVIVAFGTFAAQTLLDTKLSIGKLRGQIHRYYGVPLIVTYHPAALLRNPAWKRPTWEDVQLARRVLDRATGA